MLEAMACGTPVAAYDVPSPIDVIEDGVTGALDKHLKLAILRALTLDREKVHRGQPALHLGAHGADLRGIAGTDRRVFRRAGRRRQDQPRTFPLRVSSSAICFTSLRAAERAASSRERRTRFVAKPCGLSNG